MSEGKHISAPALPESGVEGLTAAWLSAKAQKLYQTRSVGDVEGFEAASALWSAAQCIAALATSAPAPAPAPAPVDAGGLVAVAWRVDDLTAAGKVCGQFQIYADEEKVANHLDRSGGSRFCKVTPLYDASALAAAAEREGQS